MILLSPGNNKYKKGQRTPFLIVPIDAEGEKSSLEDFQWWSKSEDFKEWLEDNPRQWTAESIQISEYSKKLFENTWESFLNERNEDGTGGNLSDEEEKEIAQKAIKFRYAYNRLIHNGDLIEELDLNEWESNNKMALFMNLADGESGEDEGITETMQAYRAEVLKTSTDAFNLIKIDHAIPFTGDIPQNKSMYTVIEDIVNKSLVFGASLAISAAVFTGAMWLGKIVLGRWVLGKAVKNYINRGGTAAKKLSKARSLAKSTKYIKSSFGTFAGIATLKNTRGGVAATIRASRIKNIKPSGLLRAFLRGSGLSHIAPRFMGKTAAKIGAKSISRAIPFVGEILMLADAGYSLWSWNRESQAPKYKEVKSFAKGEFNPKEIKAGELITVCWSQPSGSWLNWVASDETRTTMEIIKIGEYKNRSIFILYQANSKGLQEQLSKSSMILMAFNNDRVVKRGFFDNDDLDHELIRIGGEDESVFGPFVYQGHCEWDLLEKEYKDSPSHLVEKLKNAPDRFDFYFEDRDGDILNVSGKILETEEINKLSEEEIADVFGYNTSMSIDESLEGLKEFSIKTSMADFLLERENTLQDNTDTGVLDASSQINPIGIAIYRYTKGDYPNPEINASKNIPNLGLFLVYNDSLFVEDGDDILVFSSADIEFTNAKKGIYEYTPDESDEEEDNEEDSGEDEDKTKDDKEEKDKDRLVTSPSDVKYKERKDSVIIRDRIKKGGINIMNEFLTDDEKSLLQISSWKNINSIKVRKKGGVMEEIIFRNTRTGRKDRVRKYKKIDGKAFDVAVKLVKSVRDNIDYY